MKSAPSVADPEREPLDEAATIALIAGCVQAFLGVIILLRGRLRMLWGIVATGVVRVKRMLVAVEHRVLSRHTKRNLAQTHWELVREHVLGLREAKRQVMFEQMHFLQQQCSQLANDTKRNALTQYLNSFRFSVFVGHRRVEENFVRSNLDPDLEVPPPYATERALNLTTTTHLLYAVLLSSQHTQQALLKASGVSFFVSAAGCGCWYARLVSSEHGAVSSVAAPMFELLRQISVQLSSAFTFFPSFLLLGLATYTAARWRDWLVNCHTVQARLHDIGVAVGCAVKCPGNPDARRNLFRLYRYLNMVHALTYQSVHPFLPKQLEGFADLGLLTPAEVAILEPIGGKARDVIVTWAGRVVEVMIREGQVRELAIHQQLFPRLRGICAKHLDLFVRNMPNSWLALTRLLVDLLIYIHLLCLPLKILDLDGVESMPAYSTRYLLLLYCPLLLAASFITAAGFWLAWSLTATLTMPFGTGPDVYNPDALMGSSESQLFATLRASFDEDSLSNGAAQASMSATPGHARHPRSSRAEAMAPKSARRINRFATLQVSVQRTSMFDGETVLEEQSVDPAASVLGRHSEYGNTVPWPLSSASRTVRRRRVTSLAEDSPIAGPRLTHHTPFGARQQLGANRELGAHPQPESSSAQHPPAQLPTH